MQRLSQHRSKFVSWLMQQRQSPETGISCAGGLLTWILGLICLENGNMTFFLLRFGHVTGWVNTYWEIHRRSCVNSTCIQLSSLPQSLLNHLHTHGNLALCNEIYFKYFLSWFSNLKQTFWHKTNKELNSHCFFFHHSCYWFLFSFFFISQTFFQILYR